MYSGEVDEQAQLAADLRTAISFSAAASGIAAPVAHSRLLEMIVRTAAHVLHARRGSLLLIDDARQELVFEVSTPDDLPQLKHIGVPLGQGIAGLVAVTGQPMAVTGVHSDPRHAAEIAQRIGYQPQSLLCVPLPYDDTVIGVLELLDKEGGEGFDDTDVHALSLFAAQAAVAIEQSQAQRSTAALLRELLASLGDGTVLHGQRLAQRVTALATELELDPAFRRTSELAALVHELSAAGEAEARLCATIVRAVAEYTRPLQVHLSPFDEPHS